MVFSKNYKFPTEEELTVEEINISTPVFRAISQLVGKACDEKCKEFMLCRTENTDPRKCLAEGREVTACGLRFMQQLKQSCAKEVEAHAECLVYSSLDMCPSHCRKTEASLDQCSLEHTGFKRPHLGYFSTPRIHHTKKEKPKNEISERRFEKPIGFDSAPDRVKNMHHRFF